MEIENSTEFREIFPIFDHFRKEQAWPEMEIFFHDLKKEGKGKFVPILIGKLFPNELKAYRLFLK